MQEEGIDLSGARPQKLTTELASEAQLLMTMGCGDECPYVPGIRRDDWPLEDPKGQPLERVRGIRDELRARVEALIVQEGAKELHVTTRRTSVWGRDKKTETGAMLLPPVTSEVDWSGAKGDE